MKLTQRQLNRAILARQGLLERRALDLPDALDAMAGLQAQYAPSMYIGLWSRVEDLRREAVTEALNQRSIIQATLMRFTIHLVSAGDYWPLALAIRAARRAAWGRITKHESLDEPAAKLREALKDGPLRRKAIEAVIGKDVMQGIGAWVDLVRVPPQGTWEKRRADNFGLAEDWLPPPEVGDPLRHLVARYLTGFGPAAQGDIANWAGMTNKRSRRRCRVSSRTRPRTARRSTTFQASRSPTRTRPRRCGSYPPGTPRCSSTPAAR